MRKSAIIAILFICGLMTAGAQTYLPLDSCLQMAVANNNDIRSAELDIEAAKEVQRQVFTKFFPSIELSAIGFHGLNHIITMDVTNLAQTEEVKGMLTEIYEVLHESNPEISSEIKLVQRGYTAGARATQPIFAGGRIVTGYKLSKLGVKAAELKVNVSKRDVLQQVEDTYWLIAGLEEKRSTIENAFDLLDTINNVAQTAYNAGLVTRNDLLKVQLKRTEIETKQLQLENGIELATRMLCILIGQEYEGPIILDSINQGNIMPYDEPNDSITITNRPEKELLDINVQAETLRKRITIGEALPTLAIGAMGGASSLFDKTRGNIVGLLYLSIPVTQWWETGHKLRAHNLSIQKAEMLNDDMSKKMNLQNRQAHNQLTESMKLLEQHRVACELADENYRISLANYEAGISTMSELLESQSLLLRAQNDYTDAYLSYKSSMRRFDSLNK